MPLWAQFLIGGVVSLGVIVVARALMIGFEINRRPAHPDQRAGTSPTTAPLSTILTQIPPKSE